MAAYPNFHFRFNPIPQTSKVAAAQSSGYLIGAFTRFSRVSAYSNAAANHENETNRRSNFAKEVAAATAKRKMKCNI